MKFFPAVLASSAIMTESFVAWGPPTSADSLAPIRSPDVLPVLPGVHPPPGAGGPPLHGRRPIRRRQQRPGGCQRGGPNWRRPDGLQPRAPVLLPVLPLHLVPAGQPAEAQGGALLASLRRLRRPFPHPRGAHPAQTEGAQLPPRGGRPSDRGASKVFVGTECGFSNWVPGFSEYPLGFFELPNFLDSPFCTR